MAFRKRLLIGSASAAAIICAAAPAFADTATDASTSNSASTSTVKEVVVTGIKQSLQKAIQIKRVSVDQVDAISAEDIGKLPDRNVADALQRIPGINTESASSGEGGFDENDRVSVRGTSPSLTQVTVDGHNIASGDWFILDQFQTVGRSVSFLLLPAEMVQSTVVYKTQDASLLEGGVSGVVDLLTPNALDFKSGFSFQAEAEAAYQSNTGQTKPQVNGTVAWKNQDGTFGVTLQGFYEDRTTERFGQETLGYESITAGMPIGAANPALVAAGVQAPTLIGSTLFTQERIREGGHFDVEWAPSDRFDLNFDGFYSKLQANNVNDNYMYWGSNELAKNLPSSFTVANNTLTSAVWPQIAPNTPYTAAGTGTGTAGSVVDGIVVDNIVRPNAFADTMYFNLKGKFKATDNLTFTGQIGYTLGHGDTNGSPSFESDAGTGVSYAPSGNGWLVTPTNITPSSPNGLANDWAWNEVFQETDQETYGQVDGKWDIGGDLFKDVDFGFHANSHTRSVNGWDRGCTLGANNACWTSPQMPFSATNPTPYPSGFNAGALGIPGLLIPIAGQPSQIVNILNSINDGVHGPLSSIVTPQNYYWMGTFKVHEDDYSGYVMTRVGGDNWSGNFGVRLVDTEENAFVNVGSGASVPGQTVITSSAFGDYYVDHVKHDYIDVLPSVNFTFDIQKNLLLRMSAAETMSRPDYSALGGTVSINDLTLSGNGGNANLKPVMAGVYDVALEWYYAPTAVAAVSLFYDDLSSYLTFGTSKETFVDQFLTGHSGGPPITAVYSISSPVNTTGQVKGVEFQVQQPLPYNFGVQANATWLEGSDANGNALVGTSKLTANVVGYYEVPFFNVRLAYTYRSHYFVGLDRGADESQAGYGELDGSANFNLTKNVTFSVDALNMTNSLLKYYAQNPTQVRAVYDNGTQVYAGFHVKF